MHALTRSVVSIAVAAAAFAAIQAGPAAPLMAKETKATSGALRCEIAGGRSFVFGSTRDLSCVYERARDGKRERYRGKINRFGIDLGFIKKGVILWQVIAPVAPAGAGALDGRYAGVSAQIAAGAGVGANALVSNNKIMLNPVSVSGARGLNVAAGISGLQLTYVGR